MTHRWEESYRDAHRTVRVCRHCGMKQMSRHESEGGQLAHWKEYFRGEEKIAAGGRVPKCEGAAEVVDDITFEPLDDGREVAKTRDGKLIADITPDGGGNGGWVFFLNGDPRKRLGGEKCTEHVRDRAEARQLIVASPRVA